MTDPRSSNSERLVDAVEQLAARLSELDHAIKAAARTPLPEDFRDREAARSALTRMQEAVAAGRRALQRLEDAAMATEAGPRLFREERLAGVHTSAGDELPRGLARFVNDRIRSSGFEYEVSHDLERGWVLRWKDRDADGTLLGAGRLVEGPWVN